MKKLFMILMILLSLSSALAVTYIKTLLDSKAFTCPSNQAYCLLEIWRGNYKISTFTISSGQSLTGKLYGYSKQTSTTTTTIPSTTTTTTLITTTIPTTTTTTVAATTTTIPPNWCYQESTNVATGCGGLNTGSYSFDGTWQNQNSMIDGDWNTYASNVNSGTVADIYIIYYKPTNALSSSLWQVKDSSADIKFPIPLWCWNHNPIVFRISSTDTDNERWTGFTTHEYCWNGGPLSSDPSGWQRLKDGPGGAVYEEAMWWDTGA
jgi:hypothetical protein